MPAPVVLFAYNRPDHTSSTLEALSRNHLATASDVYIFSDGPKNLADRSAVMEVRARARARWPFASLKIYESAENLGLAKSVISGVTQIFETHESVIVLEDDLVTSRNFLSFMNEALRFYSEDPVAFSVTGHTFPVPFLKIPDDYPFDVYAGYRCSSWSWGTWRDRWRVIDWTMDYYQTFMTSAAARTAFNAGGCDMTETLRQQHEGNVDSWAIRFCYAHYAHDMRCIYPTKTLVRNIGLDGSGTHTSANPRYTHAGLDEEWRPLRFCPASVMDTRIAVSFRSVFDAPATSIEPDDGPTVHSRPGTILRYSRLLLGRLWPASPPPASTTTQYVATSECAASERLELPHDIDILFLNSFQDRGGAARAAYRIFDAVRRRHPKTYFGCLTKEIDANEITGYLKGTDNAKQALDFSTLDLKWLEAYPQRKSAFFSPGCSANPLRPRLSNCSAAILHLHWVALAFLRVEDLIGLKVPLVWTLHDMWAFTGGCHYVGACDRFSSACGRCPHLGSLEEGDLSRTLWERKKRVYDALDLTLVAPSHWMASFARRSPLFESKRIEVIRNGVDTDVFKPIDRPHARSRLAIEADRPLILFGAHFVDDFRKGGDLLLEALGKVDFPCTLALFGASAIGLPDLPHVTIRAFGELTSDDILAELYSAADVFVCPSREDNLPNTIAESLACGTPCVAFECGGIPEMIHHKLSGWLARPFDTDDLLAGIRWIVDHPHPDVFRTQSRKAALEEYALDVVARRYLDLYRSLTPSRQSQSNNDFA